MTSPTLIIAIRCAVLAVACLWLGPEWAWLPLALFMPVFASGQACDKCSGGTASTSYQIDVAGMSNLGSPTCTDCTSFNGTYVLAYSAADSDAVACRYKVAVSLCTTYFLGPVTVLGFGIVDKASSVSGEYEFVAEFIDSGGSFRQGKKKLLGSGSAPTCTGLSAESLPTSVLFGMCSFAGVTFTATSL